MFKKKKEENENDEKYNKLVDNYKDQSVSDYKDILNETEDESRLLAAKLTKKEIEREIGLLIGNFYKKFIIKDQQKNGVLKILKFNLSEKV
jgi:hypothetical protein